MQDSKITLQELKNKAATFIDDRDWGQFHSPKNLSIDIAVEAAELMEKFMWLTTQESLEEIDKNRQEIEDELSDVLFGVLCFANKAKIDLSAAFSYKLDQTAKKYPIGLAKGKREKYTKL